MIRATSIGQALALAALKVPAQQRPGTIANNIVWKADNTKLGLKYEPAWQVKKEEQRGNN
jgi:hypothetical protein